MGGKWASLMVRPVLVRRSPPFASMPVPLGWPSGRSPPHLIFYSQQRAHHGCCESGRTTSHGRAANNASASRCCHLKNNLEERRQIEEIHGCAL